VTGVICLQGGDEFHAGHRDVDEAWLDLVGPGPTRVLPLACAAGGEYRTAGHNGIEYLRGLGLDDVRLAPEPDLSLDTAVREIVEAAIVVIPGGSPKRIRRRVVGTAIGGALRAHLNAGGTLVGASAGAMVLASMMVLPNTELEVHPGLDVVPDTLVLPHYVCERRSTVDELHELAGDDVAILGVPVHSAVLIEHDGLHAVGEEPCWRFTVGADDEQLPHR
jgi:cyanophycinase-like exopeptidase